MTDTIKIQHAYAFRSTEHDKISCAIFKTYGAHITAWYTDWTPSGNPSVPDTAIDTIVVPRVTKTTRKAIALALLAMMHYQIAMHYDPSSFRQPELLTID